MAHTTVKQKLLKMAVRFKIVIFSKQAELCMKEELCTIYHTYFYICTRSVQVDMFYVCTFICMCLHLQTCFAPNQLLLQVLLQANIVLIALCHPISLLKIGMLK